MKSVEFTLKSSVTKPAIYVVEGYRQQTIERNRNQINVRSHVWRPPTDVYEIEGSIIVRVEIAGLNEADLSLVLDGMYLVIRGARADVPEKRGYHQMEIRFGEFLSEVKLPYPVNVDKIEAVYRNGFLVVELPQAKPSKVVVRED